MPIFTKRWNDPAEPTDGYRLLVCRHRPRGVPRVGEPWDAWCAHLAPTADLVAAFYGKRGAPMAWDEYAVRYREQMAARAFWIRGLAERVRRGETLTLLCSSACEDPARCHRTILRELIEHAAFPPKVEAPRVLRRVQA